jgi:hypothetical protein
MLGAKRSLRYVNTPTVIMGSVARRVTNSLKHQNKGRQPAPNSIILPQKKLELSKEII